MNEPSRLAAPGKLSASRLEVAGRCGCPPDPWQAPCCLAAGLSFFTCKAEGVLCHLKHLLQSAPHL